MKLYDLLPMVCEAAIKAGEATLSYYGKEIDVDYKSDNSPLTQADLASNKVIMSYLSKTEIPILSEEITNASFDERKDWEYLWIVDPLDGTKEFVKKRNEYTINIALVHKNKPVLGVIYVPVLDILYFGFEQKAYKLDTASLYSENFETLKEKSARLPVSKNMNKLVVVASQSHRNADTDLFISKIETKHSYVEIQSYGSSLKLCMIAEGTADIYPRIAPTMEWDTAAGNAIALAAGCKVVQYPSLENVVYNKENLLNPWFIVFREGLEEYITN